MRGTLEDPNVLRDEALGSKLGEERSDEDTDTEAEDEETTHRYLRLRAKDVAEYGHSGECAGCTRMRRGAKPPYRHNEECGRSLQKPITKDGRARWERYKLRQPARDFACSSPAESSDEEPTEGDAEAPKYCHGFPLVTPLV